MYSLHVMLSGAVKLRYSTGEQVASAPETPVESIAETRYVNGETRYMKIQKRGILSGVARTPQKIRQREKIRLAMLPPVSARSIPAITMWAKVDVNRRKVQISKNIRAPRS